MATLPKRYDLWYIPEFPMELPWVRPRDLDQPWQENLLRDIAEKGLRYPLMVFGHSPKAWVCDRYRCDWNKDRDESIYVHQGTNRYHCLEKLGFETFPAVLSWNKGLKPPLEGNLLDFKGFRRLLPECENIWIQEHAFGYKVREFPESEFAPVHSQETPW